jgi:hypothetical protein
LASLYLEQAQYPAPEDSERFTGVLHGNDFVRQTDEVTPWWSTGKFHLLGGTEYMVSGVFSFQK